MVSEDYFKFMK